MFKSPARRSGERILKTLGNDFDYKVWTPSYAGGSDPIHFIGNPEFPGSESVDIVITPNSEQWVLWIGEKRLERDVRDNDFAVPLCDFKLHPALMFRDVVTKALFETCVLNYHRLPWNFCVAAADMLRKTGKMTADAETVIYGAVETWRQCLLRDPENRSFDQELAGAPLSRESILLIKEKLEEWEQSSRERGLEAATQFTIDALKVADDLLAIRSI